MYLSTLIVLSEVFRAFLRLLLINVGRAPRLGRGCGLLDVLSRRLLGDTEKDHKHP
jgi:hypothetical protein